MNISPARTVAFDVLIRIERDHEFSSTILPEYEDDLDPKDAGLCHEIVYGVLRRQLYLDKVIDVFANGKKIDLEVRIACRIGLFQLQFLDRVPPHSIVNESVNLAIRARKRSAKGFVNAFLRRATRDESVFTFDSDIERISVATSHPLWLIERWERQFGLETAERIAEANNIRLPTSFRTTAKSDDQTLVEIADLARSKFVQNCYFETKLTDGLRRLYKAGKIHFQDEGSQLVGASIISRDGSKLLDVCAAPGGKTAQIVGSNSNMTLIAGDRSFSRIEHMRRSLDLQGIEQVKAVQIDAENELPFPDSSFDAVFVDAPCSGTGTIRSNPELRYLITQEEIADKTRNQLQILKNASKMVKSGGELIYSTCSLEKEENEVVVEAFLESDRDFAKQDPLIAERFITLDGFARTIPHRDQMDGFFLARLKRS